MTITELVERTGLTDAELAVKLTMNPVTPYHWRKGHKLPRLRDRKALCKLAGVALADVTWERALRTTRRPRSDRLPSSESEGAMT